MFKPEIKLELADDRGEIYSIGLPDGTEFMLIHSKEGTLRGGHSHNVSERVMLLTGQMMYHKVDLAAKERDAEWTELLIGGDSSFNAEGVKHMGEFLEDTWLVEVKPGTPAHTAVDTDYQPFRKRVRGE